MNISKICWLSLGNHLYNNRGIVGNGVFVRSVQIWWIVEGWQFRGVENQSIKRKLGG
jgi:hypothetical protein